MAINDDLSDLISRRPFSFSEDSPHIVICLPAPSSGSSLLQPHNKLTICCDCGCGLQYDPTSDPDNTPEYSCIKCVMERDNIELTLSEDQLRLIACLSH